MKKLFSILVLSAILITTLISCGTQGSTDSQSGENNNIKQTNDELYAQLDGGKYLDEFVSENMQVKYSNYKLIYTYDEFLELAENASSVDASVFEENVVLYIKNEFPFIGGENVGYSNITIIDGAPYISYQKYYYEDEAYSEAIIHYNDYVLIPKAQIPTEMNKSGKIGLIMNNIYFQNHFSHHEIELTEMEINTGIILETADEVNEFKEATGISKSYYPSYDRVVLAVYVRRPQWSDDNGVYQGYYYKLEGGTLKVYYMYKEDETEEMREYVDFLLVPKRLSDEADNVLIEVKPRLEPAIKRDDSIE